MGSVSAPPPRPGAHGRLLLVPNSLDLGTGIDVDLRELLPQDVIRQAAGLQHWVAENARTTRAFLKRVAALVPLALPLQQILITELPRPGKGGARPAGPAPDLRPLLAPALAGHDLGLLSEAGMPAVADPGAELVWAAQGLGLTVLPLPGPSALLLALAASGLNGQRFAFEGYLPVDAAERAARIRALDAQSARWQQTQIVIETPYRNQALLSALVQQLLPDSRLAVASGLSLPQARCRTMSVQAWRQLQATDPAWLAQDLLGSKLPAVFSWLAR